jgi:hypothetical protein
VHLLVSFSRINGGGGGGDDDDDNNNNNNNYYYYYFHIKSYPSIGLYRPRGLPGFLDNRHMKMARLSALRTGRFYPKGKIPGTHLC